jgi:hypothetical protein
MKKFALAQVLTVTTGKLLCHVDGLYQILNHLTGDSLFTHQLPRAGEWAKPVLLAMFPVLKQVNDDDLAKLKATINHAVTSARGVDVHGAAWRASNAWVEVMALRLGSEFEIEIEQQGNWTHLDPVSELSAMINTGANY